MKNKSSVIAVLKTWLNIVNPDHDINNMFTDNGQIWICPSNADYVVYGFTSFDNKDYGCEVFNAATNETFVFKKSSDIKNFIQKNKRINHLVSITCKSQISIWLFFVAINVHLFLHTYW